MLSPSLSLLVGVRAMSGLEVAVGVTMIGPTFMINGSEWFPESTYIKSTAVTLGVGWTVRAGRLNFPLNVAFTPSRGEERGLRMTFTTGVNWSGIEG